MKPQVNYFNATDAFGETWMGHIIGDPVQIKANLEKRGYTKVGSVPFIFEVKE